MKHLSLLLLLIGGIGISTYAQFRGPIDPPTILKENFERDFPDASSSNATWWEETNHYVVTFMQNSYSMRGFYSRTGKWVYTEIKVPHSLLKQKLFQYLDKNYPGFSIQESILHDEKGNNFYQININWRGGPVKLQFQEDGTFIKKMN